MKSPCCLYTPCNFRRGIWDHLVCVSVPIQFFRVPCSLCRKGKKGIVVPVIKLVKHYAVKAYGEVDV
jgi:hypothetical protein